jgi:sigma-B regulation protein RsbU (phosphoserine phosphatase)
MMAQLPSPTTSTQDPANLTELFRLAGEIGKEPNLNSLLLKILERSRAWMQVDACSIFLPDDATGELVIHSSHGSSAPQLGKLRIPPGRGIVASAMSEKAVIKVDDTSKDPRFYSFADKKTGYRTTAVIAAPLLDGGNCIGVIEYLNPIGRPYFSDDDVQMVEYFSWLVAAALVRIAAHEATLQHAVVQRDLDLAREMQEGMLPTVFPSAIDYPRLDLYATLDPAYEVSGDLYDFFPLSDGRLCFLVGDVAGKGVAAGLFMAVTRTLIRAVALQQDLSPVDILTIINNQLYPDNSALLFVTMILGFLDPETFRIDYAQGGHNPPLLIASGSSPCYEPPGGQPIGVFPDAAFGFRSIQLNPGDVFLIYTDGVTEAMNESHQQFTDDRLLQVFGSSADGSAKDVATRVVDSVHAFVEDADQSDDITVMAIKRRY